MIIAYNRHQEELFDEKMSMLAWQTSLLMNATGNYKKAIKPKDLYTSLEDRKKKETKGTKPVENMEELRTDILSVFGTRNNKKSKENVKG